MNKVYQVAIIGGGASGLLCAIELLKGNDALKGEEVIILEGNDRGGKKLIATGNGQGNLTNRNLSTANYYGDKEFISNFIDNAKEISLENYFYSLGIPLIEAQDGKMYPISKQASAVLDILRIHLEQKKCKTEVGFKVDEIFASKNTFIIKAQHNEIYAKKVVLSTGGKAQKQYVSF